MNEINFKKLVVKNITENGEINNLKQIDSDLDCNNNFYNNNSDVKLVTKYEITSFVIYKRISILFSFAVILLCCYNCVNYMTNISIVIKSIYITSCMIVVSICGLAYFFYQYKSELKKAMRLNKNTKDKEIFEILFSKFYDIKFNQIKSFPIVIRKEKRISIFNVGLMKTSNKHYWLIIEKF